MKFLISLEPFVDPVAFSWKHGYGQVHRFFCGFIVREKDCCSFWWPVGEKTARAMLDVKCIDGKSFMDLIDEIHVDNIN